MEKVEQWQKLKEIVGSALEKPAAERDGFLDQVCAGDSQLRAEAKSLLFAYRESDPLFASPWRHAVSEADGRTKDIGAYHLVKELGVGGMGQVWLAEQTEPVRRHVALKLIRAGMYDPTTVQRFKAERQSLAIMDHPAIAKVFDAGTTPVGQPYLVMEYVNGLRITDYCDSKKLSIRDRLQLFMRVCEGVQHAHQKAIIHRDLKPSNILVVEVDGKPMPRIIDFGLAKATAPSLSGETLFTHAGTFLGTPGYMSPEQADTEVRDVDTRSDVYSLGVILYELLTGFLPFETTERTKQRPEELWRQLRDDDPPRPSTRVSSNRPTSTAHANLRNIDVKQLASVLRGDLDAITMKALEKDRERRYPSSSALMADIENFLRNRPLLARPANRVYSAKKYVRRHAAELVLVSTIVIILATGTGVSMWQARRAQKRFSQVRHLANAFLFDFEQSIHNVPGTTRARQLLVKTALEYLNSLSRDAAGDADLTRELASAFEKVGDIQGDPGGANLGNSADAAKSYQKAISLRLNLGDKNSKSPEPRLAFAKLLDKLSAVQLRIGNVDEAAQNAQQAVSLAEELVPATHTSRAAVNQLAFAYINLANAEGRGKTSRLAEGHCKRAIEILEPAAASAPDDRDTQKALASAYWRTGLTFARVNDWQGSVSYYQKALPLLEGLSAEDPSDTSVRRELMVVLSQLGYSFVVSPSLGLRASADRSRRAIQIAQQAVAADPANVEAVSDLVMISVLTATVFEHGHQYRKANEVFESALNAATQLVKRDPSSKENQLTLALTHMDYGAELADSAGCAYALREYRLAEEIYGRLLQQSPDDFKILNSQVYDWLDIGDCMSKLHHWSEARHYYVMGLDIVNKYSSQQPMFAAPGDLLRQSDQKAAHALAIAH